MSSAKGRETVNFGVSYLLIPSFDFDKKLIFFYKIFHEKLNLINKSKFENLKRNNYLITQNKKILIMGQNSIEIHNLDTQLDYVIDKNSNQLLRIDYLSNGTISSDGKQIYFSQMGSIFSIKDLITHRIKQIHQVSNPVEGYEILPDGEIFFFLKKNNVIQNRLKGNLKKMDSKINENPQQKINMSALFFSQMHVPHIKSELFSFNGRIINFKVYKLSVRYKKQYFILILCQNSHYYQMHEIIFEVDAYNKMQIFVEREIFSIKRKQKFIKSSWKTQSYVKEFLYNMHEEKIYLFVVREKTSGIFHKFDLEIYFRSFRFKDKICIGNYYNDVYIDNWQTISYGLENNISVAHIKIKAFQTGNLNLTVFLFQSGFHFLVNKIYKRDLIHKLQKIYEDNQRLLVKISHLKNRLYVLKNNLLTVFRLETGEFLVEYRIPFSRFIADFSQKYDLLYIFQYDDFKPFLKYKHEFDLNNFKVIKKSKIVSSPKLIASECISISPNHAILKGGLETYREVVYGCLVSNNLAWDISHIPIGFIPDLFKKEKYRQSLRIFSNFYFSFISKYERRDNFFGELNPLYICVYHKDATLLEELLGRYYYPEITQNFNFSPLKYAFDMKYSTCISSICEYSLKTMTHFPKFTFEDFHCLLTSNKQICHVVLARMFKQINKQLVPNFIQMKGTYRFDFKNSLMEYIEANGQAPDKKNRSGDLGRQYDTSQADYRGFSSSVYDQNFDQGPYASLQNSITDEEDIAIYEGNYYYDEMTYKYRSFQTTGKEKKIDYYKHKNKRDPK